MAAIGPTHQAGVWAWRDSPNQSFHVFHLFLKAEKPLLQLSQSLLVSIHNRSHSPH